LWYEYPIPADIENQRKIIRQLRKWIQNLESRGIIQGFAFNHYFPNPSILNIRFDCIDDKLETIRKELTQEVKRLLPNYVLEERLWDAGRSPEYVYKAYELGSRSVFLFWELVERGRFTEEFASDFLHWLDSTHYRFNSSAIPFVFQFCFSHGVMNSLGIHKIPNEQLIHLMALIESTKSFSHNELCEWIRNQPIKYPKKPE
jgi:hypothetical protein